MTPEGKVKERVKALLRNHDAYWHMPVQTGYGAPALDFHVCVRGLYMGIETKAPGKKPTPRQLATMEQITAAGGTALVVDGGIAGYTALESALQRKVVVTTESHVMRLIQALQQCREIALNAGRGNKTERELDDALIAVLRQTEVLNGAEGE